jgi:hypothetical protein
MITTWIRKLFAKSAPAARRPSTRLPGFRPALEGLEARQLLSGTPAAIASSLTHSPEDFSNFVTGAYRQYLGRLPDAAGLANWVAAMQSGLSDERLEASFIGSPEYIANHGGTGPAWVQGMYRDLLGRTPSAAEVDGWVNAMNQGMAPPTVAYGFAASAEREGQRVTADYQKYLGRTPSASEVQGWVNAFVQGISNEDVVTGFVGSPEYYNRAGGNTNPAWWLVAAYLDVLGRSPSDSDCLNWVGRTTDTQMTLTQTDSAGNSVLQISHRNLDGTTVRQTFVNGKLIQQDSWDTSGSHVRTSYDAAGNVITVITDNAAGKVELDYAGGKEIEQKSWDALGNFVRDISWSVTGTVQIDYASGKVIEQQTWDANGHETELLTWDLAGNAVKSITWAATGIVETHFANGKTTEKRTWDAAAVFLQDITWAPTGTVETDYAGNKITQLTWDAAGNYVKSVTWGSTGILETDYAAGKVIEQRTWDPKGNFLKDVTWSSAGTVETDFVNNPVVEQKTWDAAGNFIKDVIWSPSATVETDYVAGTVTEQKTWDAAGNFIKDVIWTPSGPIVYNFPPTKVPNPVKSNPGNTTAPSLVNGGPATPSSPQLAPSANGAFD